MINLTINKKLSFITEINKISWYYVVLFGSVEENNNLYVIFLRSQFPLTTNRRLLFPSNIDIHSNKTKWKLENVWRNRSIIWTVLRTFKMWFDFSVTWTHSFIILYIIINFVTLLINYCVITFVWAANTVNLLN